MTTPIRLVIADDHDMFRQGLRSLLALQPDIEIAAEVDNAREVLSTVQQTRCEMLLLDLGMERSLLEDIETLSRLTTVVVLTASDSVEDAIGALRLGARAIVQKRFAIENLIAAIRTAADGLVWVPPALQAELAARLDTSSPQRLTSRESEVVRYVAVGMRNAEVAKTLSISESTVKTHLNNIFQKLGLRDRVELTLYAIRVGLASARFPIRTSIK
jgi:two-component system NarL family response regulator